MTTTTQDVRLPHPAARLVIRQVLEHYEFGLNLAELRRRCSRSGTIYCIDSTGKNVVEPFAETLEHLLDAGLVQQRLVGRSIRFVDPIRYPSTTEPTEDTAS